jgi:hypothetical protein
MARHILAHCSRTARSMKGSARSRFERAATCSLVARSSKGLASFDTLILMPAIETALSLSDTCADRLGSSRQFAVSAGRATTTTWPRISAFWSSTRSVSLPTSLPRAPPSRPAMVPVRLPATPASWPVSCNSPFSGMVAVSSFGRPLISMLSRRMVMPILALDSRLLIGLLLVVVRSRGVALSRLARMAGIAMATGATT